MKKSNCLRTKFIAVIFWISQIQQLFDCTTICHQYNMYCHRIRLKTRWKYLSCISYPSTHSLLLPLPPIILGHSKPLFTVIQYYPTLLSWAPLLEPWNTGTGQNILLNIYTVQLSLSRNPLSFFFEILRKRFKSHYFKCLSEIFFYKSLRNRTVILSLEEIPNFYIRNLGSFSFMPTANFLR